MKILFNPFTGTFDFVGNSNSGGGGIQSIVPGLNITVDNTDPENPIVSSNGENITVVANYSALPPVATVSGQFFWCSDSQGTSWLPGSLGGTYYSAGLYYSNGVTWEYLDVPYQATQIEVDAGVNNDKFITPLTFTNTSKWTTLVSNVPYDISWDGDTLVAPSKNALYNKILYDNIQVKELAKATVQTGLVNGNDTFNFVALDDFTVRINAVQSAFFRLAIDLPENAIKSFSQQDYALSLLAIPTDTIALRFIGYDKLGVVQVSATPFANENILALGTVIVKNVSGVITFLDGSAGVRNVFASPAMASNSALDKTFATSSSNVKIGPNANTTVENTDGFIKGISIAWGTSNINLKAISASNPVSFAVINPASASSPTPPAFTTIVPTTQYWNGSTMVNLTGIQSVVKRWLITRNGQFYLQEGEQVFANLVDAKNAVSTVSFTDIFPSGTFIELCRMAVERVASDLSDDTKAFFLNTGSSSGGGTVTTGGIVSQAVLDFGSTNAFNASVFVSDSSILPSSKILLSLSGEDTANYTSDEILMQDVRVIDCNIVSNTGFTIKGYCPKQTKGLFKINYTITY